VSKIPAEQRPYQWLELTIDSATAETMRGEFELPKTWSYYDDLIIKLLHDAWVEQEQKDQLEEARLKISPDGIAEGQKAMELLNSLLHLEKNQAG
jgi:hypothetical protein